MPGAPEALAALADSGLRLGLVTATNRSIVQPQIERFGMAELFEVLVCGDEAPAMKPDPAPLRQALEALGLLDHPAGTTYVGDAPDDMRMARAVGSRADRRAIDARRGGRAASRRCGRGPAERRHLGRRLARPADRGGLRPVLHALIVADGDAPARAALDAAWPGWADGIGLVVAADGGARAARALGLTIDLAVGDFDSLGQDGLAELERDGVAIERSAVDKDETDTELAIEAAVERGATRLTVIGAFGGARIDHGLANVGLLGLASLEDREAVLLDPRGRVSLLRAPSRRWQPRVPCVARHDRWAHLAHPVG